MFKKLFEDLPVKNTLLYLLALITIAGITYSNHFQNEFHFDDSHTAKNNIFIQDIKNIPLFFKDGTTFSSLPSNQSYRPIVSTSLAIDYWMGNGYNMFYFHLNTFIMFLLQGILMFFFFFKIFQLSYKNSWNFYIAAIATAWYVLHPGNAETVNYIIARSDIQSTFFAVVGFVMYLFSPFSKRTYLYLIPVGIGALAKPPSVMFAPMLFCYILLFEEKMSLMDALKISNFKRLFTVIKKSVPAFVFCAFMYLWVDHFTPKTWESGGFSVYNYLITQPFVIFHYFITFFLPFGLSADTDWQPLQSMTDIRFILGMAFILSLVWVAFRFSKDERLRPISFGILWFFLALIPSSSVIAFAEVMNDHRIYFPYIGLAISVCWTIGLLLLKYKKEYQNTLIKYEHAVLLFCMLALGGYAYGVHERNKVWKTEESLWYDVTVKSPGNARGLMNYGLSQMAKGDYPVAEKYFTEALTMWPRYSTLHVNMGILKAATGDPATAETYFNNAIQYGGGHPASWFFYGRFLMNQQRYADAIEKLNKTIELTPAHIDARSLLMRAYQETGEWEKLNQLAQNTLEVNPGNAEAMSYLEASKNKKNATAQLEEEAKISNSPEKYLDLSLKYYQLGNYEKCIEAANAAIQLKPDYAEAYNNIGNSYNLLKNYPKAIEALQKALSIKPDYELAKNNLQVALNGDKVINEQESKVAAKPSAEGYLDLSLSFYNQGLWEKCIEACNKAIQLKPGYADAYSNMGACYNQLKQWDKAIVACQQALKSNPEHKLAKGNLNWALEEKAKSGK
ncbi:MAG: tetratricopeptide repeat protein [Bacteroidetes bacterium]|nr:tetratricopeptide repeat protein [Bacteroidota bacterium]